MALATLSDTLPGRLPSSLGHPSSPGHPTSVPVPAAQPGLATRMASLATALAQVVADLDPGLLLGSDAAALYGDFARLERLVVAGKTLLAPRIAESGHWETEGHRSAAGLLATLEGGSAGAARRTLETGRRLADLPGTTDALRAGTLSGPKLTEIAQAAASDPGAEGALLAGSGDEPLQVIKERCAEVRATSAAADPVATWAAIAARRSFTWWNDAEGAFCYQGRDTAERGAALLARLVPVANRLRHDRRAAATTATPSTGSGARTGRGGAPSPPPSPEPECALRADALFLLVTDDRRAPVDRPDPGEPSSAGTSSTRSNSGPDPDTPPDLLQLFTEPSEPPEPPGSSTDPPDPPSGAVGRVPTVDRVPASARVPATDRVPAVAPATIMVRVDLDALRRGRALAGECSAIDGQGPVPVPVVWDLMDDAFVALVFCGSDDIRAIAHLGRTINAPLRTALAFRDRCCVVPGCGVAYGLEIDHVVPLAEGGPTALSNLALLCRHHHRAKTYEGWVLCRTGPSDADPGWSFTPQPPFGQEPGLGIDRPPAPVPRR